MGFPELTLLFQGLDGDGDGRHDRPHLRLARDKDAGDTGDSAAAARAADAALATRLAAGDDRAFDELFRYHFPRLTAYVRRFVESADVAEDLAQDALIQLWAMRTTVRPDVSLTPLLRTIVRRATIKRGRHAKIVSDAHHELREIGETPGASAEQAGADRRVSHDEIIRLVRHALASLPPRVRLVAIMRWLDDMGRQDIAAELGVSVRTVDAQLYQAAARIRGALAPYRIEIGHD